MMTIYVVLCQYDGVLRSDEEGLVYIGTEINFVLIVGNVAFNLFEGQIRHINESVSCPIKITYSSKYGSMSICAHVCVQEDLTVTFMICTMSRESLYISLAPLSNYEPSPC